MFSTRITIHRVLCGQQKVVVVLREHGRDLKKKQFQYDDLGFWLGCLSATIGINLYETISRNRRHEGIMKPMREEHAELLRLKRELEKTTGEGGVAA